MDLAQNHFFSDICSIIETGRRQAYAEVSRLMMETYWKIGQRIVEEEQLGNKRADYGTQLLNSLSEELTLKYGKGFSKRQLGLYENILSGCARFEDFAIAIAKSDMDTFNQGFPRRRPGYHSLVSDGSFAGNVERAYTGSQHQYAVL